MKKHLIKKCYIFDIDGVLLDRSHRYKLVLSKDGKARIDLEHWRANEHRTIEDKLLPLSEHYKKVLKQKNSFVIIATSRIMSAVDYQVVEKKLGKPHALISRLTNEQKGGDLKLNGVIRTLADLKLTNINTFHIFEDNATYLKHIADGIKQHYNVQPFAHYIVSNQGY